MRSYRRHEDRCPRGSASLAVSADVLLQEEVASRTRPVCCFARVAPARARMLASVGTARSHDAPLPAHAGIADVLFGWSDRPTPLPGWARFYVDLGASVETIFTGRRWTAIAAPTRGFAAALIAVGHVLGRVRRSPSPEPAAVESAIRSLRVGTRLFYYPSPVCKWEGEFGGVVTTTAEFAMIRIRDRDDAVDSRTICVPVHRWDHIIVPDSSFPVARLRASARRLPLAGLLAGLSDAKCLAERAHLGLAMCHIIGNLGALRREICDTLFSSSNGISQFTGTLNDVLRVKRWSRPDDGVLTDVLSARETRGDLPPQISLAIYDGASAFLRYRDLWQPAHSIVVLDRAEHQFEDAAAEVNRLLISGARLPLAPGINPPRSVEIATFEVRS